MQETESSSISLSSGFCKAAGLSSQDAKAFLCNLKMYSVCILKLLGGLCALRFHSLSSSMRLPVELFSFLVEGAAF